MTTKNVDSNGQVLPIVLQHKKQQQTMDVLQCAVIGLKCPLAIACRMLINGVGICLQSSYPLYPFTVDCFLKHVDQCL